MSPAADTEADAFVGIDVFGASAPGGTCALDRETRSARRRLRVCSWRACLFLEGVEMDGGSGEYGMGSIWGIEGVVRGLFSSVLFGPSTMTLSWVAVQAAKPAKTSYIYIYIHI